MADLEHSMQKKVYPHITEKHKNIGVISEFIGSVSTCWLKNHIDSFRFSHVCGD
jgi:hypothetical protein